jgi:hypothetical protein
MAVFCMLRAWLRRLLGAPESGIGAGDLVRETIWRLSTTWFE